ncbi:MAG: DDE-type integrase/transposase/recombinase, partial [Planktothrix sp.]
MDGKKTDIARAVARSGKFQMKPIAEALEVSRPNLVQSLQTKEKHIPFKTRKKSHQLTEDELVLRLKTITNGRPSYGYRRACAVLNRELLQMGYKKVNHKRVYRLMKESKLLLPKFIGFKPERTHEGKVVTLRSNTRWCSDALQIRCWDGRKIEIVFVMDTCDREILGYVATIGYLDAKDVQDMLIMAFENRFSSTDELPHPIEWLTDNGGIFIAEETKSLAKQIGFIPCQTPAYS